MRSATSGSGPRGSATSASGPARSAIRSGSRPGARNQEATAMRVAPRARSDRIAVGRSGVVAEANAAVAPAQGYRAAQRLATVDTAVLAGAWEEPAAART